MHIKARGRVKLAAGIAKLSLGALAALAAFTMLICALITPFIFLAPIANTLWMAWVLLGILTFGFGFALPLPVSVFISPIMFATFIPAAFISLAGMFGIFTAVFLKSGVASCRKAHRLLQKDRLQTTENKPLLAPGERRLPSVPELRESFERSGDASDMRRAAARRHVATHLGEEDAPRAEELTL